MSDRRFIILVSILWCIAIPAVGGLALIVSFG